MKKVLILGSRGMLGHIVYYYLKSLNKYQLFDSSFEEKMNPESLLVDATNKEELKSVFKQIKPDIAINCIGILIKSSAINPANAILLNSYLPHFLSNLARETDSKIIHISTDCVFSGNTGSYKEDDFKDAQDIYGLSKSLGELNNNLDLTLRTSIIGPELVEFGEGLFHWFMNQTGTINGFTEMVWGGVTTLELAKVIDYSIDEKLTGLIHVTNNTPINKHDLIKLFKDIWRTKHININPIPGKKVNKSLICTRRDFKIQISSYHEMLQNLKQFMLENKHLYNYKL